MTKNQNQTVTETRKPGGANPPVQPPTVKLKKDGTPRAVRGPSGPRQIDKRITDLKAGQDIAMVEFKNRQDAELKDMRAYIDQETKAAKMAARLEKKLLDMSPAEKAWMAKATADQLAIHADPEPEQRDKA